MIGHLDPIGGASGDMFLGALLDAGLALDELTRALGGLDALGVRVTARPVERGHVKATQALVTVDADGGPPARTLTEILDLLGSLQLDPRDAARAGDVFRRLAAAE